MAARDSAGGEPLRTRESGLPRGRQTGKSRLTPADECIWWQRKQLWGIGILGCQGLLEPESICAHERIHPPQMLGDGENGHPSAKDCSANPPDGIKSEVRAGETHQLGDPLLGGTILPLGETQTEVGHGAHGVATHGVRTQQLRGR